MTHSDTDLDLLAFCYLTDDLPPAERQAFELQLATEQSAREALARAVELTVALRSASRVSVRREASVPAQPRPFDRAMRTVAWVAIASAACLAVVIGVRALPGVFQHQPVFSPETALAWSEVRDTWPESAVAEALSPAGSSDSSELPSADDGLSEAEASSDMPGWLLAAVEGAGSEFGGNAEGESPDDSNNDVAPDRQEEL